MATRHTYAHSWIGNVDAPSANRIQAALAKTLTALRPAGRPEAIVLQRPAKLPGVVGIWATASSDETEQLQQHLIEAL